MEFEKDDGQASNKIQSYREGCVTINQTQYVQGLVVLPEIIIHPWGPTNIDSLTAADFEKLLALLPSKPQVVLIGTGPQFRFIDPALYAVFTNQQIGVEIMDTFAACRTYQVLMAEGREVLAALIL